MDQYWVISDSCSSFSTSDFSIEGKTMGLDPKAYCRKKTLHGGRQEGVEIIEISNGIITLRVCPTHGMSIIDGYFNEHFIGWRSPVQEIVHPQFINLYDLGGRGCHYGFNEFLNRCGVEWSGAMGNDEVVDNMGQRSHAFLPLHGKVGWTPASRVVLSVHDGVLSLEGDVPEQNVFGVNYVLKTCLRMYPSSSKIEIEDTLCNLGTQTGEYEMLYHTNFGPPFLEQGSKYYGSYSRVIPRDEFGCVESDQFPVFKEPASGFIEEVYLFRAKSDDDCMAHQVITNAAGTLAAHVSFAPETLPYTILWKRTAAMEDGYVAGMNPCTDLPNNRSFERKQNRVAKIEGNSQVVFKHCIEFIEGCDEIARLVNEVLPMSSNALVGKSGDFSFL